MQDSPVCIHKVFLRLVHWRIIKYWFW